MTAKPNFHSPINRRRYAQTLEQQIEQLATDEQILKFAAARQRLASDPYRPTYHFVAPEGKMNDPNGLCRWQGRFHLFYQTYPPEAGRRQHWGHAVSDDLVHWHDLPLAIYPDIEEKCFSGSTLVEPDRVIAMYHGKRAGNMVAMARDALLLNWEKLEENPVIPLVDADERGYPYRVFDPCIWKEEDGYFCLSGSYQDGKISAMKFRQGCRPVAHLFSSQDLRHWAYRGPFVEGETHTDPGEDAAVPYFWPLSDKHILLFASHMRGSQYHLGDYDRERHRFKPFTHGRFNFGPIGHGGVHAPSATPNGQGGCYVIHNINEGKQPQGWSQIMSLTRVLTLRQDNTLGIEPIPDVESLRGKHTQIGKTALTANREIILDPAAGNAIEIDAEIDPQEAREICLNVLRSPDGQEYTAIRYYQNAHSSYRRTHSLHQDAIAIDPSRSSLRPDVLARAPEVGPVELDDGELLRLRVFIDHSVVEVFVNGRQCLALRIYPQREDSIGVSIEAVGQNAVLQQLDYWQMQSLEYRL